MRKPTFWTVLGGVLELLRNLSGIENREEAVRRLNAFAPELKLTTPQLGRMERGEVPINTQEFRVICRFYEVPADALLEWVEDKTKSDEEYYERLMRILRKGEDGDPLSLALKVSCLVWKPSTCSWRSTGFAPI